MSQPRVAAISGGCGATTVAAALQATDLGVYRGGPCEVLVARDTVVSVGLSHRAVNAAPGSPVLVVVASTPSSIPRAATARLETVRPYVASIVQVPYVGRWREVVDPWEQAAAALARPPDEIARYLRGFATAMRTVQRVLQSHGRAGAPRPAPAPPPPPVWTSTGPVAPGPTAPWNQP